ncbi:hypothetical protein [Daejeonella sp.]|uniref:hypothetical protein n=1 Tax=Daejeonella sp. TaxID=2805397 RepID=UPI002720882C|nr:hypothetical protein [Daejeonella sp.]MDO8992712.1 hypothetical protein [Daejeonella sp.]MDP2413457.1 hypothetical protein [Daejeonella sp.]
MNKILLFFIALSLISAELSAQLQAVPLEQRVENSTLVFEGRVLRKSSFWDTDRRHIYTSNLVSVYKVFKGELSNAIVEVITIGGIVGNEMEKVSYGLDLQEGSVGVFTCIPNNTKLATSSKNLRLRPYAEIQGFIRYDLATGTARDVFKVYKNVSGEIYPVLQKLTHSNYKVMNKADF